MQRNRRAQAGSASTPTAMQTPQPKAMGQQRSIPKRCASREEREASRTEGGANVGRDPRDRVRRASAVHGYTAPAQRIRKTERKRREQARFVVLTHAPVAVREARQRQRRDFAKEPGCTRKTGNQIEATRGNKRISAQAQAAQAAQASSTSSTGDERNAQVAAWMVCCADVSSHLRRNARTHGMRNRTAATRKRARSLQTREKNRGREAGACAHGM